jgi:hypothetical protein
MAAKDIKIAPAHAPGKGVAEALKHGMYMAKSATISPSSMATPQALFNIPKNAFVQDLILQVSSSYNGNYVIAGFASDCDCLIADTETANPGFHSMKNGLNAAIYKGGFISSCDYTVRIGYDGSTGSIVGFLVYSCYGEEL